ncbi:hypothetical protein DFQ26_007132 [Actinomortierella ambigua]|nr:hypothetical protein DFQ26_007132 [Actinomortierella ambigua]
MAIQFRALAIIAGLTIHGIISSVEALPATGLIDCLKGAQSSNGSFLNTATSQGYDQDRMNFGPIVDRRPIAIFHPDTVDEVAAAIKCAATFNATIAPRSGGHSFTGYSLGGSDGALVIDVSRFQQFSFDPKTKIATVGAGMRLGPLYINLWNAGKYLVPGGSCPSVGVGGHALGGGLGPVGRKFGMLLHSIVSLTMVDGQGRVRHINATSEPELFWAMRGAGGGSFGLVTEFQFQAYKAPSKLSTLFATYPVDSTSPMDQYLKLIHAFGNWSKVAPEDATAVLIVNRDDVELMVTVIGSENKAKEVVNEYYKLAGEPMRTTWDEGSWYETAKLLALFEGGTLEMPLTPSSFYLAGHSLVYRKPMSDKEISIISNSIHQALHLDGNTEGNTDGIYPYAMLEAWGGKIDNPASSSVFDHHHGVLYSVQYAFQWLASGNATKPGDQQCSGCLQASAQFGQEMQAAYSSGPVLEAYQNYIEQDIPNALWAYYGAANLPRLQQVKKNADPMNLFSFPHSIPLP